MNENTETKVADALAERGTWIKVGAIRIYAKPLTMLQVQEIGELVSKIKCDLNQQSDMSISNFAFDAHEDVGTMSEVFVIALFRRKIFRRLFGSYVKRHLTSESYKTIFTHINSAFDYSFFLTSLIFLKGTTQKKKKEAEDTNQATAHGEWSEV